MLIEFILCLVAVLAAFLVPNLGVRWFLKSERLLNELAKHRGLAVLSVGLFALALRAALLPVAPIPQPQVHDEFSYLLMGDTFAHGRLANPTHPMWVHFETFHVNQKPRYVSIYYPAQGVFLALGQVVLGHPFWGVWLSVGIMCAAICWMLQAWLPPIWALVGGLLAVIRLGTFSYWGNSYWGGAVAAIGGALVLGSFPRIKRDCRTRDALLLALGLLILANSRPYEGLFFSLPILAALIKWLLDRKFPLRTSVRQVVLPLCLMLSLGTAAMVYYFWRTTGDPFLTPYVVNLRAYNPVPFFPWQAIRAAPEYHHAEMKNLYFGWWLYRYIFARSHPILLILLKTLFLWMFFLGTLFILPVLMSAIVLPYGMSWKDVPARIRLLLLVTLFGIGALLLPIFIFVHYAALLTGAIYLLVLLAMQRVRRWKWHGRRTGLAIVRSTVAICALLFVLRGGARTFHIPTPAGMPTWCSPVEAIPGRAKVLSDLAKRHGNLLVIVRYRDSHNPHYEWVYNGADIDGSRIVWAHDMGVEKNQELLNYFRGREVWLIEPDEDPVRLSKYPSP